MKKCFLSLFCLIVISTSFAQLPLFQWAKPFEARNENNPSINSNARSIAVDKLGNVYSAGQFDYTVDFDPGPGVFTLTATNWTNSGVYISKLNSAGEFLWAIQIPTYTDFGNIEIRVDGDNNVYIASELRLPSDFDPGPGVFMLSPIGPVDAFVAKYDSNGNLIWAKQFGGPGDTVPKSDVLDIDNENNVVICGKFNRVVDFDPGIAVYNMTSSAHIQAFIVKLNSNGEFIWARQFGNSPIVYSGSNIVDVKCDTQGNIYAIGDFSGSCDFDSGPGTFLLESNGLTNPFISKMNRDGNLIWAKSITNTTKGTDEFSDTRGIDVDANQNIYVTGDFYGTFDFDPGPQTFLLSSSHYDWYLLKLNKQGDLLWANSFGGIEADIGSDVAVGNDGSVYAVGVIGHIADMDAGPGTFNITTVNDYGASALVKVSANGGLIYALPFDQVNTDYGESLTRRMVVDDLHNIYITGSFAGVIDFDPGPGVYSLMGSGPFVLKLARCKNITTANLNINSCSPYKFNNEIFDSSGTYTRIILNSTGCDSIITIHLTINKKYTEQNKTICEGESFFAGGEKQTVSGIYIDTLTSSLNCDSIVTTRLTVNPSPLPILGPDRDLCAGTASVISPGSFTQYLWQDMSTSSTFTVSKPGLYWVKVNNELNCSVTDSLNIKSILPSPDNFLKKVDSICRYQKLPIDAKEIFNQYLWSNGAVDKQITVDKPGSYWLSVTDAGGCTGTDSIIVYPKDCLIGVYVPTAFTPNNDGINDVYKAIVFGEVLSFRLQVFGREGQLVFQTTDHLKGWDGSYKGKNYSSATFVWQCSYQLKSRQPEYQKGTVTIIR